MNTEFNSSDLIAYATGGIVYITYNEVVHSALAIITAVISFGVIELIKYIFKKYKK